MSFESRFSRKRINIEKILLFSGIFAVKMLFSLFLYALTYYKGTDEFGTIAGASILAGLDWHEAISRCSYYGFGYSFLMTPILILFDNSYMIYHLMYAYNAICLALSAVLCYTTLTYTFNIKNKLTACLISIASTTFIGNWVASNNIINDTPMILFLWITIYLLFKCVSVTEENKKKYFSTLFLTLFLVYGLTIHTRILYLWGGVIVFIITYYLLRRKVIVNIPIMLSVFVGGYRVAKLLITYVQRTYWLAFNGEVLTNSVESLGNSLKNFRLIFTVNGFGGAVSTILGQFWGMMSLSGGFLILFSLWAIKIIYICFSDIFKNKPSSVKDSLYYSSSMMIIAIIVAVFSTITLGATSATSNAFSNHVGSKWYLYERYWGVCAGPLIMLISLCIFQYSQKVSWKVISIVGNSIYIITSKLFLAYIAPQFEGINNNDSYVYYLYAPFCVRSFGSSIKAADFFFLFLISLCLFNTIIILLGKKHIKSFLVLLILFNLYGYSYVTIEMHRPASEYLYNEFYDISQVIYEKTDASPDTVTLYCEGNIWYHNVAQFTFPRFTVKWLDSSELKIEAPEGRRIIVIANDSNTLNYLQASDYEEIYSKEDSYYYDNIYVLYK